MLDLVLQTRQREDGLESVHDVLLPSDWACLIKMISLGFPMVEKEEKAEGNVTTKNNKWSPYYA